MKPIEIHIEGYKIVISEDENVEKPDENQRHTITIPCYPPTVINPTVTWTSDDSLNIGVGKTGGVTNSSTTKIIRDYMVNGGVIENPGKKKIGDDIPGDYSVSDLKDALL